MKVRTIKVYKFLDKSYDHTMSILNTKGQLAFNPRSCKEEFYYGLGKHLGFGQKKDYLLELIGPWVKGKVSRTHPRLVFYYNSKTKKRRKKIAKRILKMLEMLTTYQKLRQPIVSLTQKGNAMLISIDPWYIKSPVAISALLSFIRGAARSRWEFDNLDEFLEELTDRNFICECDDPEMNDGEQINQSKETIDGFLDKNLECFRHEGFEAWRHAVVSDFKELHDIYDDDFNINGFVEYDPNETDYQDWNHKFFKKIEKLRNERSKKEEELYRASSSYTSSWEF